MKRRRLGVVVPNLSCLIVVTKLVNHPRQDPDFKHNTNATIRAVTQAHLKQYTFLSMTMDTTKFQSQIDNEPAHTRKVIPRTRSISAQCLAAVVQGEESISKEEMT